MSVVLKTFTWLPFAYRRTAKLVSPDYKPFMILPYVSFHFYFSLCLLILFALAMQSDVPILWWILLLCRCIFPYNLSLLYPIIKQKSITLSS